MSLIGLLQSVQFTSTWWGHTLFIWMMLQNRFPSFLELQDIFLICEKKIHRNNKHITPPPKKRSAEKKFICWYSRLFEINEFYHIYGIPGICFHGYLPKNEFGEPEFDCYEPSYGYSATILRTTNPSNCPTKIPPQPTFFADVIIWHLKNLYYGTRGAFGDIPQTANRKFCLKKRNIPSKHIDFWL